VQAPTGGSVILAAVLLKMGTYGFLRFAMPLFPSASHRLGSVIAGFAVIGILYGAFCAWKQSDVKKLVAYSSVSHLGFVMLGMYSITEHGISGSILQMVSHGVSTGALFLLVGVIYERRHTRDLSQFGGLAKVMPLYATVFVIVSMSSIGLPGTNGFVGEFMILSGAFLSEHLAMGAVLSAVAAVGVILGAVYMLHAVLKMFWGPLDKDENRGLPDLTGRESLVLAPLVVLIFWMGLYPKPMLSRMEASVDAMAHEYKAKLKVSDDNPETRGMIEGKLIALAADGSRRAAADDDADGEGGEEGEP
jgi:NADH-quinone oxidoreductase subunit M